MKVKIIETGEIKELSYSMNGTQNDTGDMIGNHDGFGDKIECQFKYNEEEDLYETSEYNFDWWKKLFDTMEESDNYRKMVMNEVDNEEWEKLLEYESDISCGDLESDTEARCTHWKEEAERLNLI